MKRNLQRVCLFIGYLLACNAGFAQNDTATWALTANQSATAAGNITAASQSLTGLAVNNYLSGSGGQRVKTPSGDWPAETGPNSSRYLQYAVTPGGTDNLLVTQVSLGLSFNSSGVVHASIAWSVDGTNFTNIVNDLNLVSGATPSVSTYTGLNLMVLNGQTFYLRVSPWSTGAQTPTKYLVSKNVVITGTVTTAITATWALTADQGVSAGTGMTGSA
ncbi:MAG: hypothetical protein JST39_24715, partial [Bacteroidetes bacterium]|nr:hypothetical protein [Bacteroidota bacterium]